MFSDMIWEIDYQPEEQMIKNLISVTELTSKI